MREYLQGLLGLRSETGGGHGGLPRGAGVRARVAGGVQPLGGIPRMCHHGPIGVPGGGGAYLGDLEGRVQEDPLPRQPLRPVQPERGSTTGATNKLPVLLAAAAPPHYNHLALSIDTAAASPHRPGLENGRTPPDSKWNLPFPHRGWAAQLTQHSPGGVIRIQSAVKRFTPIQSVSI